jgi:hypothetical protein
MNTFGGAKHTQVTPKKKKITPIPLCTIVVPFSEHIGFMQWRTHNFCMEDHLQTNH